MCLCSNTHGLLNECMNEQKPPLFMCAAETPRLNSLDFSQQVMVRIIAVVVPPWIGAAPIQTRSPRFDLRIINLKCRK